MSKQLTAKQRRFVSEYLKDLNGTQAVIRAGYSKNGADVQAVRLLANARVQEEIQKRMAKREEKAEITQEMVLRRYWEIATANVNELMQYRRICCRYCYGKNHKYQWRDLEEFSNAMSAALQAQKDQPKAEIDLPSDEGGMGFNPTLKPAKDCPKCFGEGHGEMYVKDTNELTGAAALLYAGVKQTREGLEIKVHDQQQALEKVAQHLGMFKQRHEVTGKNGGPIEQKTTTSDLTDEELERELAKYGIKPGTAGAS